MPETEIKVEAKLAYSVKPTEDSEKIEKAASVFFPQPLTSTSSFLPLRQAIFSRKIIDTVSSRLRANASVTTTFLLFHKQALLAGKVTLVDSDNESPLGSIRLQIESPELNQFIAWLAPKTVDGIPVTD